MKPGVVDQLRRRLGAKKFRPFRIDLADGRTIAANSPGDVTIARGESLLWHAAKEAIDLADVMSVEAV